MNSEHFVESDYLESSVHEKLLKKTAVPSIFKFPVHLQTKQVCRRPLVRYSEPSTSTSEIEPMLVGVNESNVRSVETLKPKLLSQVKKLEEQLKNSRSARKIALQVKRRNDKIKSLKGMVKMLHDNNIRNECLEEILENNFSPSPVELFKN